MALSIKTKAAGILAAAALSTGLLVDWEGVRYEVYYDIVGIPTVCAGTTQGVALGKKYTEQECLELLLRDAVQHAVKISHCLNREPPKEAMAAFISLAYNIGTNAFCDSTLVRMFNEGNLAGACDQILRWVYAGGKVVRGLQNRRKAEHEMCVRSIA